LILLTLTLFSQRIRICIWVVRAKSHTARRISVGSFVNRQNLAPELSCRRRNLQSRLSIARLGTGVLEHLVEKRCAPGGETSRWRRNTRSHVPGGKHGVRISKLRDIIAKPLDQGQREFSSVDGAWKRLSKELAFSMLDAEQPLDIGTAGIVWKKSLSRNWRLNWM